MGRLIGVIPAAGKGTRIRPFSSSLPKSMIKIHGVPNLQRNVELMRDQLGIEDVVIITGYLGRKIEEFFQDGSQFGVRIRYIRNTNLERGLAWSVLLAQKYVDDYFCVILSDESYTGSNHAELLTTPYREAFATCVVREVDDIELIRRNYAVAIQDGRIERLIEKPRQVRGNIMGCGTFVFSPKIFPRLEKAFAEAKDNYVEFVSFLGEQCGQDRVLPFFLSGQYVNINDRDALHNARYYRRHSDFAGVTIALLVYSEGQEDNVSYALRRYRKLSFLDAIRLIVPHENSIEEEARRCGAEIIKCPPGVELYGEKVKYALDSSKEDLLLLAEADYAFPARDIDKLLVYVKDADMVVGTRTTRQLMERSTDLSGIVRLANVFVAKLLELLWWHFEGRFTDVGCTFRAIWRTSYLDIRERLKSIGPEFSAEMMIELLNMRMRIIEIPVNYFNVSRAMRRKYRNVNTFFRFVWLLLTKRFPWVGRIFGSR